MQRLPPRACIARIMAVFVFGLWQAAIDEAARLAEQWVTKDAFAVEQAKTEELERVAQQMRDELERRRSMSAGDLLSMLEGFMDLENETDVMKDQAETLYKVGCADSHICHHYGQPVALTHARGRRTCKRSVMQSNGGWSKRETSNGSRWRSGFVSAGSAALAG